MSFFWDFWNLLFGDTFGWEDEDDRYGWAYGGHQYPTPSRRAQPRKHSRGFWESNDGRWPQAYVFDVSRRREMKGAPGGNVDLSASCGHPAYPGTVTCKAFGRSVELEVPPTLKLCHDCFVKWLERYGRVCDVCGGIIMPGEEVAQPTVHPGSDCFVHAHPFCCPNPLLICGRWGMGRLVSLHEIDPKLFEPGTMTLADHRPDRAAPPLVNKSALKMLR
ncbi:hypothetical protein ACFL26_00765 [Patescibacteria group bacterium]